MILPQAKALATVRVFENCGQSAAQTCKNLRRLSRLLLPKRRTHDHAAQVPKASDRVCWREDVALVDGFFIDHTHFQAFIKIGRELPHIGIAKENACVLQNNKAGSIFLTTTHQIVRVSVQAFAVRLLFPLADGWDVLMPIVSCSFV
jgi:hypothetical protein